MLCTVNFFYSMFHLINKSSSSSMMAAVRGKQNHSCNGGPVVHTSLGLNISHYLDDPSSVIGAAVARVLRRRLHSNIFSIVFSKYYYCFQKTREVGTRLFSNAFLRFLVPFGHGSLRRLGVAVSVVRHLHRCSGPADRHAIDQ